MSDKQTTEMDAIPQAAIDALAEFPLPDQGLTSQENYRRVLDWLYSGAVTPAALIVGLSYSRKVAERMREMGL